MRFIVLIIFLLSFLFSGCSNLDVKKGKASKSFVLDVIVAESVKEGSYQSEYNLIVKPRDG